MCIVHKTVTFHIGAYYWCYTLFACFINNVIQFQCCNNSCTVTFVMKQATRCRPTIYSLVSLMIHDIDDDIYIYLFKSILHNYSYLQYFKVYWMLYKNVNEHWKEPHRSDEQLTPTVTYLRYFDEQNSPKKTPEGAHVAKQKSTNKLCTLNNRQTH